jgi:hypothetical protein
VTDPNYTHIVHVVDRSGSMGDNADPAGKSTKADNATKGIRTFNLDQLADTKPDQTCTVSLYQFDTEHDTVLDFVPVTDPKVAAYRINPRGGTALLDALGFAITKTGEALEAMAEASRPRYVLFVVSTDGLENSSTEYTKQQVKGLITQQADKYGWVFTFLGADIDAFHEAEAIGIGQGMTLNTTAGSYTGAYSSASGLASRYRGGATGQSLNYSGQEREAAKPGNDGQ